MIQTSYSIFYDFDALQAAHRRARICKRNKASVIKFEMDEVSSLLHLKNELEAKTYKTGRYFSFMVYEPKPRKIDASSYRDRVVQHILCDLILEPYFTKRAIFDNMGCVRGRGHHLAVARMRKFLKEHYHEHGREGFFLKCDISKYFHSLSHEAIKKQITSHIADPDIKNLFNSIVDSFQTEIGFLKQHKIPAFEKKFVPGKGLRSVEIKRGVPIGNQSSQIIGMFHLNPVDRLCKEKFRVKHYIRYMDDFILVHHDRAFLEKVLLQIKDLLWKELKLVTNSKTQIHPIKNGVKFLGNYFYIKEGGKVINKITQKTTAKFRQKIKLINKHHETLGVHKIQSILSSYKGHFHRTSSRGKAALIKQKLNTPVKQSVKQSIRDIFSEIEKAM